MLHTQLRLLLVFCCVAGLSAQQAPPTPVLDAPPVMFRTEINYVEVDATVTDAQGNPVMDLTQADFEVLEDGKPQTISTFAVVNIPIVHNDRPVGTALPIERDVQVNERADGRLYLIVLDSLHTHPLNGLRVRQAVRDFIEQDFGTNDLAAVVHTSGRADLGQDFTGNRRLLLASIDRFVGEKLRSQTLERLDAFNNGAPTFAINPNNARQRSVMDPFEMERASHARRTLGSLERLSDYMAGIRGRRKALVFVSEGLTYDMADPWSSTYASSVSDRVRDAIGAATRANVSIFAIDPRGLATNLESAIEIGGVPGGSTTGVEGVDIPMPTNMGLQSMMGEAWIAQQGLRTIADETGGFAAVNRNDFKGVFERVVRENSAYYLLGYYPPSAKRNGKFHRITVKVKRPGVTVRSRKGYAAPRGKAPKAKPDTSTSSPAMREAMNSPIPVPGLPMRVFAAAFKGTAPNASVAMAVELDASGFGYVDKDGVATDVIEVAFTPIDRNGVIKPGKKLRATLSLKPETLVAAKARGIRVLSEVDMPPGRYQIRVAASEEGAGLTGMVLYDLEVPDFFTAPLTMSGVALTAASSVAVVTVGSEGMIAPLVAGPTTANREFSRDDTLALFAEVYENEPDASPHTLEISASVRSADGRMVFKLTEEHSSTELQAGRGGFGFMPQIPLKDFEPGIYLIHVEARSRMGKNPKGIGRDIEIRVRP
jgi:VWFA-related protein